jgi:hypothetical protein
LIRCRAGSYAASTSGPPTALGLETDETEILINARRGNGRGGTNSSVRLISGKPFSSAFQPTCVNRCDETANSQHGRSQKSAPTFEELSSRSSLGQIPNRYSTQPHRCDLDLRQIGSGRGQYARLAGTIRGRGLAGSARITTQFRLNDVGRAFASVRLVAELHRVIPLLQISKRVESAATDGFLDEAAGDGVGGGPRSTASRGYMPVCKACTRSSTA